MATATTSSKNAQSKTFSIDEALQMLGSTDDDVTCDEYQPSQDSDGLSSTDHEFEGQRGKKRLRNPSAWKRNKRKQRRNSGLPYLSSSNKQKPAIAMRNLENHNCRLKCTQNITEEERINLFTKFWELSDFNSQNAYICGTVMQTTTARIRSRTNPNESRRSMSREYNLLISTGTVKVCKAFFLSALGVTDGRVTRCLSKQLNTGSGIPTQDERGKHENHKTTAEGDLQYVKMHIESFPIFESHYTRSHQRTRKYLSPDLNVAKMYQLYTDKCEADKRSPLKEWIYRRVFTTQYNLSFHQPRKDTCKTCDSLKIQIDVAENQEIKRNLEMMRDMHHRKAEKVRTASESSRAKEDPTYEGFTFDLQSTLPTPQLSTGVVFYKRQLWTYNLGIRSMRDNDAIMYMWNETCGKRGANEIGSCLLHYVRQLSQNGTKKLTAYSDSCGGQNRNMKIALFWSHIVSSLPIDEVNHKFMVSGHSYLPNDQDFGVIERVKRTAQQIFVPEDWYKLVASARKRQPFKVVKMDEFVDSADMGALTVHRKKCTDGHNVNWLKIQWIRFTSDKPLVMQLKYTTDDDAEFHELDLKPMRGKGRLIIPENVRLTQLYDSPLPVNPLKRKDLIELLMFVPSVHHPFYNALKTTDTAADQVVTDMSESDESE